MTDNRTIQLLSAFPDAEPSPYFDFVLKSPRILDIAFTFAQMPAGTFTFKASYDGSPHSVLHLNTADNDYYQRGIPGVTRSIEETAAWLRTIRRTFGFQAVRVIGASMAGYAAVLFGDLIDAELICALSPVTDRSHTFLGKTARFESLDEAVVRIRDRAVMTFGAFDVVEYKFIASCLDWGLRLDELAVVGNMHGCILSFDLPKFLTGDETLSARELLVNPYAIPLDDALIREVARLNPFTVDASDTHTLEVLERAAAVDRFNPAYPFRRAVLLSLRGETEEAMQAMRDTFALTAYHRRKAGFDVFQAFANYEKRVLQEYGVSLDFARLKPLVEMTKEAARTAHLSRVYAELAD